jgi:uncharacterized protein
MAIGPERKYMTRAQADVADIDVGLRKYMLKIYDYMAGGLVLTGLIAFGVAQSPALIHAIHGTPLFWVLAIGSIIMVATFGARIERMSVGSAQLFFWGYAAVLGLILSSIFVVYSSASIAQAFFVTAGTFAGMSLYGYTTKRDLSGIGSFLVMGVWGLFLALIVNMFLQSPAVDFALSAIGVLIFTGLTAYKTQWLKEWYAETDGTEVAAKKAIYGALSLYITFINLFMFMLRFLGVARSN